ncbi:unnamed protein product [Lactuca virosa]|uniref:Uncharacterized protein n=1 Tax=Lactuca virosa TaxID=75947 RepID=A0AAU9MNN5_9ASTR|nr:unnamed protein product [Lactuca virosa]
MLNQLQGVSESSAIPKQGGEDVKEKAQPKPQVMKPTDEQHEDKPKIDAKVNEASGSIGKEKLLDDDDKVEEELSEGEKLIRKKLGKVVTPPNRND